MISIEGMSILDAINHIKNEINILQKEIDTVGHLEAKIPLIMALAMDEKSKLQQELDDQENKARQMCKDIGLNTTEDFPMLCELLGFSPTKEYLEYLAVVIGPYMSASVSTDVPQSPCESKFGII
ncbi:hypothetical protein ISN45_Aa07g036310 [Arabidopsis thaliana x Arabidopsis arenosa]|uniref:Uncharacterized protein n=1 Tax=Arabidopsis thaliana x Arabidopsis arenosa TaxID=1240361 RepID=A0A8T1YCU4_9BRAS|nr:hypothetical protein ISN45_Aa07g036310 [Arabidopsis thaliana x Arabidopsis arenosa]